MNDYLPKVVRCAFVKVLTHCYVDRVPNRPRKIFSNWPVDASFDPFTQVDGSLSNETHPAFHEISADDFAVLTKYVRMHVCCLRGVRVRVCRHLTPSLAHPGLRLRARAPQLPAARRVLPRDL